MIRNKNNKYIVHVHGKKSGKTVSAPVFASWFQVSVLLASIKVPVQGKTLKLVCGKDVLADANKNARAEIVRLCRQVSKAEFFSDVQVVVEVNTDQLVAIMNHKFDTVPVDMQTQLAALTEHIERMVAQKANLVTNLNNVLAAKSAWDSIIKTDVGVVTKLPSFPAKHIAGIGML